jgi:hypothetical protein
VAIEFTDDGITLLERVLDCHREADDNQRIYRGRWEHYFSLFRGFVELRQSVGPAPNDTDVRNAVGDAQREWGAELFIPRTFATVETIVPGMLSNRPKMLVLPRRKKWEQNAKNQSLLIDAQQEQIHYELTMQETCKTGLIYGLGVQKGGWHTVKKSRRKPRVKPLIPKKGGPDYVLGPVVERTSFDDPMCWDVDPFDFLWDPYGSDLDTCGYVFHRSWRSTSYVVDKITSGAWKPMVSGELTAEDVNSIGPSPEKYDTVWSERLRIMGLGHRDPSRRGQQMHEVLEYHDGDTVITVLDQTLIVNVAQNPTWHGNLPFAIFRPSLPGTKQLPGIGVVEPMEHLQIELNTLRRQRRDNATLKLMQTFAYRDGVLDPADLKIGPGWGIPVTGDPREVLFPLMQGDIPNSSYQEEQGLVGDMDVASGIDDTTRGADAGAAETATGVQLVQAAANRRIQNATRRAELELAEPMTRLFIELNQAMIIETKEVRRDVPAEPGQPDRRWAWFEFTPEELEGEFTSKAAGGSTAPENTAQMRADAQMWSQLVTLPGAEQRLRMDRVWEKIVENMGEEFPEAFINPAEQPLPAQLPEAMKEELITHGFDEQTAAAIVDGAVQMAVEAEQKQQQAAQGPGPPGAPPTGAPDDPTAPPSSPEPVPAAA